jgi:hypothetical protein
VDIYCYRAFIAGGGMDVGDEIVFAVDRPMIQLEKALGFFFPNHIAVFRVRDITRVSFFQGRPLSGVKVSAFFGNEGEVDGSSILHSKWSSGTSCSM